MGQDKREWVSRARRRDQPVINLSHQPDGRAGRKAVSMEAVTAPLREAADFGKRPTVQFLLLLPMSSRDPATCFMHTRWTVVKCGHIYKYAYMHEWMRIYLSICLCISIYTHEHTCLCVCECMWMSIVLLNASLCKTYIYTYTTGILCIFTHIHTYTH